MFFVLYRLDTCTSLCIPPFHNEICYPRKSLKFQKSFLGTVTSVLDSASMVTQDFTLVEKLSAIPARLQLALGNHQVKWICCVWSLHMQDRTRRNLFWCYCSSSWSRTNALVLCPVHIKGKCMDWTTNLKGYPLLYALRFMYILNFMHFCPEEVKVYPWMWRPNNFFNNCVHATYGWWAVKILDSIILRCNL